MKAILFCLTMLVMWCGTANAQKAPNKQVNAFHAPDSVSIDGSLTEWGNKFQAYNKSTELFYTLSNDDTHLYLILQSKNALIAQKMVYSMTFSLSSGKRQDGKTGPYFVFPLLDQKIKSPLISAVGKQARDKIEDREIPNDTLITALTLHLNRNTKVRINGLENCPDTVTHIRSSKVFKAAAQFNKELMLTYEISIPLKELRLKENKFIYNIKLNGSNPNITVGDDGRSTISDGGSGTPIVLTVTPKDLSLQLPTDFNGDYKLVGNPTLD